MNAFNDDVSILKDKKTFLRFISEQATMNGNSVSIGHYYNNGMSEYHYPYTFQVFGDTYSWSISTNHTRMRHLCTHYELWFHGKAFPAFASKIATGELTKSKLFKGFEKIRLFYIEQFSLITTKQENPLLSHENL